jgi:hypothetical protein
METVRLRGQDVPAEDIYWVFSSHPVQTVGGFASLGWETAEFVPRVPGEYIIDRWALSGPVGVWTDRFIVGVGGELPELAIDGPRQVTLGESAEYQTTRVTLVSAFNWVLSRPTGPDSTFDELVPETGGKATFRPALPGVYAISCLVVYEDGTTETTTLSVRVME